METVMVLFEVKIREGKMDEYLKRGAAMKKELEKTTGFIRSERFSSLGEKGKLLSLSVWKDEESVLRWRNAPAHRENQRWMREEGCDEFSITVVTASRCYSLTDRREAPKDSNEFFHVK